MFYGILINPLDVYGEELKMIKFEWIFHCMWTSGCGELKTQWGVREESISFYFNMIRYASSSSLQVWKLEIPIQFERVKDHGILYRDNGITPNDILKDLPNGFINRSGPRETDSYNKLNLKLRLFLWNFGFNSENLN